MVLSSRVAHVLVVAGQSNAAGWNMTAAGVPANLQSTIRTRIWTTNNGFQRLVNGSNNGQASGYAEYWGPEAEFSRQYVADRPGVSLWIVKYAIGSTDLAVHWASGGAQRNTLTTLVTNAKTALTGAGYLPTVFCCLWMQGESDALTLAHANAYETNLRAFSSYVRSSLGDAETRLGIGRISNSTSLTHREIVRSAQVTVANEDSRSFLVNTDAYALQDGVHYTRDAYVQLGADFYSGYRNLDA